MKGILLAIMALGLIGCSTTIETPDRGSDTTIVQPAPVVTRPAPSVIIDP